MNRFLFDPDDFLGGTNDAKLDNKTPEFRHNKKDVFGSYFLKRATYSGKYDMPKMLPYNGPIPENYVTFSECSKTVQENTCLTFYDNDTVLERIWNNPQRQINRLKKFDFVSTPDFSMKIGQPICTQITNSFRNKAMGYYFQQSGLNVIPSVSWSNNLSYDFCFDGYSQGGAVIVSTIGILRDERTMRYFFNGFDEMLKHIKPDAVILYGDVNDEITSRMPNQLSIYYAEHIRYKRLRSHGKQRSI